MNKDNLYKYLDEGIPRDRTFTVITITPSIGALKYTVHSGFRDEKVYDALFRVEPKDFQEIVTNLKRDICHRFRHDDKYSKIIQEERNLQENTRWLENLI